MTNLWPWLSIAGLGAVHGISPAGGWMFAAACGIRAGGAAGSRRALVPIAIGHTASIAVLALAVSQGMRMDINALRWAAGLLLIALAAGRLAVGGARRPAIGAEASHAGIALWSFVGSSAQGTGLMLVPALVPMCLANSPARDITASGSLLLALAAVAVHAAAMLLTTGLMAQGAYRVGLVRITGTSSKVAWLSWPAVLLATGGILVAMR